MTTRLVVNRATAMGELVVEVASHAHQFFDKLGRLKAAADAMSFGSDNAQVAAEPGLDVSKVPDFLSILQFVKNQADASNYIKEFVARCEQG